MVIELFFLSLWISLILTGDFMYLKSRFLRKSLSPFPVLAGSWSAGYKYLTKHHLKHSLSLIFWISMKPFLDGLILLVIWYNYYQLRGCTLKYW